MDGVFAEEAVKSADGSEGLKYTRFLEDVTCNQDEMIIRGKCFSKLGSITAASRLSGTESTLEAIVTQNLHRSALSDTKRDGT